MSHPSRTFAYRVVGLFTYGLLVHAFAAVADCDGYTDSSNCTNNDCYWHGGYRRCFSPCSTFETNEACKEADTCRWAANKTMCQPTDILTCPPAGVTIDVYPQAGKATRFKKSKGSELCTLSLLKEGAMEPISRSYGARPWEVYAGKWSNLPVLCNLDLGFCSMHLPQLQTDQKTYQLTSFTHTIKPMDRVARFLEQATFGPTLAEIDAFPGVVQWLKEQIVVVPATSHRAFFREHVNDHLETATRVGLATQPCQANTRYRKWAFEKKDFPSFIQLKPSPSGKVYVMVDGYARTVARQVSVKKAGKEYILSPRDEFYEFCRLDDGGVGNVAAIKHPTLGCLNLIVDGVRGNPSVYFDEQDPPTSVVVSLLSDEVVVINKEQHGGEAHELFVTQPISDAACADIPTFVGRNLSKVEQSYLEIDVYQSVAVYEGDYYLHSPRFALQENSLDDPLADGGAAQVTMTQISDEAPTRIQRLYETMCSNVPRTVVNEDSCVVSYEEDVCHPSQTNRAILSLQYSTFQEIFGATGGTPSPDEQDPAGTRYIYAVDGLRLDPDYVSPPCAPGTQSRWKRMPDMSYCDDDSQFEDRADAVDGATRDIFAGLIRQSADTNPFVRDIFLPSTGIDACTEGKFGFTVAVDGGCWRNVHPDLFNVYDFTLWVSEHGGGPDRIRMWAQSDSTNFRIVFPLWHEMHRWHILALPHLAKLGRLGDEVRWSDLPRELLNSIDLEDLPASSTRPSSTGLVVCGSPYEVANVAWHFGLKDRGAFDIVSLKGIPATFGLQKQAETVWVEIALKAPDQLRQRVAWWLSQLLAISPGAFPVDADVQTECFLVYYDIFVRHAFGNYRDVLREISLSPMMATMLTYLQSKSTAYTWAQTSSVEYADENFAREIMQLFTFGLHHLNMDGTMVLVDGKPVLTYTAFDITEYARVWTGFDTQGLRGNIETSMQENRIDPMMIRVEWRDHLPKMGLDHFYIGDGWPLCSDLPRRHFLKKGAMFRLLGTSSTPELHEDPVAWADADRPSLEPNSLLYQALCDESNGQCMHKVKVVLDADLASCTGQECLIDTLRVFRVGDVFYEYVRLPCALRAFFENAKLVKAAAGSQALMCADPLTEVASTACCIAANGVATVDEKYSGERVTYSTAESRCDLCSSPVVSSCGARGCDGSLYYWTQSPCQLQVKIDLDSRVAIVHQTDLADLRSIDRMVQQDTKIFFRVDWGGALGVDAFTSDYDGTCTMLGCERDSFDDLCLCDVSVSEEAFFSSAPTWDQVLASLRIGAHEDALAGAAGIEVGPRVTMYAPHGAYAGTSVFEVVDENGVRHLRLNRRSTVSVGNGGLTFRNPLHLIALADPEVRDAQYETEAALDHYFYHASTAPFLAVRIAQRFGFSNPSPRYVETIATAFRTGLYEHSSGESFGSGNYGDLGAMVAAVLLDPEARIELLDVDPAHGSILEPYLKLVRIMRSLEYIADSDRPFLVFEDDMQFLLGEGPHKLPSVFSYFRPDFASQGRVSQSGLKAPEAEVLTGPKVLNFLNGAFSLIKYGFEGAYGGFGFDASGRDPVAGSYDGSTGQLTLTAGGSSESVVSKLASLLTSGRLTATNQAIVAEAYESAMESGKSKQVAMINAQQLIVTTAEFHSNAVVQAMNTLRQAAPVPSPSTKPYKAVVQIHLSGGMDSFNLLVPHSCESQGSGVSLRQQYEETRGGLAFTNKERNLIVNATGSNQPCSEFAIHPELPVAGRLYNDGNLLFVANVGVINQNRMTKLDYKDLTLTTLFAHDAMEEEAQRVDPYNQVPGTGVLGRIADELNENGFAVNKISIDDHALSTTGALGKSAPAFSVASSGSGGFNRRPQEESYFDLTGYAFRLNPETKIQSSIFAETWSDNFFTGVAVASGMSEYLSSMSLSSVWDGFESDPLAQTFQTISKLIKTHDKRGTDRDMFYASFSGWDHHTEMKAKLRDNFRQLNKALDMFVSELRAQGIWNDVVIVVTTDFGRTLTINSSSGSDHAWGSNTFVFGGSVRGGRILGKYPNDITADSPLNIGRGIIMPTTAWEAIWNGVGEWLGVSRDKLDAVAPNRNNAVVPGFRLFSKGDLFLVDEEAWDGTAAGFVFRLLLYWIANRSLPNADDDT